MARGDDRNRERSRADASPRLTRRRLLGGGAVAIAGWAGAGALTGRVEAKEGGLESNRVPTPGPTTKILRVSRRMLDPDGKAQVPGVVVNDSLPGPEIRVREGDVVRLQLENHLEGKDTLVHWHGLLVPAPMDGVPKVTNLPLKPGRVMIYEFPIRQSGTYWYHSHVGLQEQVGLHGAFVIEPRNEPGRYDHDAVVLLGDWLHSDPDGVVPRLRAEGTGEAEGDAGGGSGSGADPGMPMAPAASATPGSSTQMGGGMKPGGGTDMGGGMKMGAADLSDVKYDAFLLNGRGNQDPWTLAAKPGQRVRLRLINAGASTYFFVSLDGHALEVTHADGLPVRPVVVDRILMGMAECYDVVVRVSGSGSFTLHAVAQDGSGQALGVIHTPDAKPAPRLEIPKPGPRLLSYAELRSPEPTTLPDGPPREVRLALGGDMKKYIWTINGAVYPDADPLLVRQGERVHVELVNQTGMWHPMHLHGHFFRVLTDAGPFCPLKHTVNVAPRETVRIEFGADNPGSWFFHCHNLYHFEAGMARVWEYETG